MDDLIVIILTLIFIVAGFFGQVKKQRATAEGKAKVPPAGFDPREFQDEEWEEPPVRRPEVRHPVSDPAAGMNTAFNPEAEGESILSCNLASEKETPSNVKTAKKKKFPLREAVIYSEILKQKYF